MLASLAAIKLCRGCFNLPTVEHSFCFVYISLIPSWRRSRHTLDAFIYSIIVSFIIFLRVVIEPDFLCGQCWAHFIASRGERIKQFDMSTAEGEDLMYYTRRVPTVKRSFYWSGLSTKSFYILALFGHKIWFKVVDLLLYFFMICVHTMTFLPSKSLTPRSHVEREDPGREVGILHALLTCRGFLCYLWKGKSSVEWTEPSPNYSTDWFES